MLEILNEKSGIWAGVLKFVAVIEGAVAITLAVIFLLKAVSEPAYYGSSESYLIFSVAILICGVVAFVINMVIANALYNLQEIRKAVTKDETHK